MKRIICLGLNGRGGTLHYASNLTSNMAKFAETSLLLPSYSNTKNISKKVKLLRISAPPNPFKTSLLTFNLFIHKKIIKKINAKKPDVINILDIHPWYVLYWHFLKAKKKIVTINDPELHSGETGFVMGLFLKFITRFLLKHADEIIVLGENQKKIVRKLGYKQKIIVSRIGAYDFFTNNKNNFATEHKTMLFFGRIKDYKGLDYLLDACILLKNNGEKFKLIIVGEGEIEKYMKKLNLLKNEIELHKGFVPDEKVSEYFQRAAFVVMPYIDATQTGVVQVAYSFKKPVIATNVGSLSEVVIDGKTGIIVPPKNVFKLSKAIKKLLRNPKKLEKMGNSIYLFLKKELDWKNIVKRLNETI